MIKLRIYICQHKYFDTYSNISQVISIYICRTIYILYDFIISETVHDLFDMLSSTLDSISKSHKCLTATTEDVLLTKNLSHEMVREKTFKTPHIGVGNTKIPVVTPAEEKEEAILQKRHQKKKAQRKHVSRKQKEVIEKTNAGQTKDEAIRIKPSITGNFLGFTHSAQTGNGCSLCKESCKKNSKGTINMLGDRKYLNEHIQRQHHVWVCSCLKWGHYITKLASEAKKCTRRCWQKHLIAEPMHKKVFSRRLKTFKMKQVKRDLCAKRKEGTTIEIVDKNHEVKTYTDECPCFCESCIAE